MTINMHFHIASGRGYVMANQFNIIDDQMNLIYLDVVFGGIQRVSFNVEEVLSNKIISEKLIVNIETDGSIDFKDAFLSAMKVLHSQVTSTVSFLSRDDSGDDEEEEMNEFLVSCSGAKYNINLFRTINEIEIPVRANNAFIKANVLYLGDLVKISTKDLISMANLGKKSLDSVSESLKKLGLCFDMATPVWPPSDFANLRKQYDVKINTMSKKNQLVNFLEGN